METAKYLYLTTTGHRSGQPHEIEIWYIAHAGCYYLISEKREAAHWVRNLRAQPAVRFRLGDSFGAGDSAAASASVPESPELIAAVKAKMQAKHGWSNGLVVEIRPL